MKRLPVSLICFICFIILSCHFRNKSEKLEGFEKDDLSHSNDYVAIDIKGHDSLFSIVIQSSELFYLLLSNKQIQSPDEFNTMLQSSIEKGVSFSVGNKKIEQELISNKVNQDTILDSLLVLNRSQLLESYFTKGVLNRKIIDFEQEKRIIYCLVKLKVRCFRNDISGSVMVSQEFLE